MKKPIHIMDRTTDWMMTLCGADGDEIQVTISPAAGTCTTCLQEVEHGERPVQHRPGQPESPTWSYPV